MKLTTLMGRLRLVAFVEGLSFLLILFVTMPLKYLMDMPQANKYVGMGHGVLFILYVLLVIQAAIAYSFTARQTTFALLASVIPFGTFVVDSKVFRHIEEPKTAA